MPLTDLAETARYVRALAATSRLLKDIAGNKRVHIPADVRLDIAQALDRIHREVTSADN